MPIRGNNVELQRTALERICNASLGSFSHDQTICILLSFEIFANANWIQTLILLWWNWKILLKK